MKVHAGSHSSTHDLWIFEEQPERKGWFPAAVLLALLTAGAVTIGLTGMWRGVLPVVVILSAGVLVIALRWLVRKTVVIDRQKGIASVASGWHLWRRRQVRALDEFDRVAVWERRTPIDAGYFASLYSIVLVGGKGPLPLLTTDDEKDASAVRDEVAAFLRFR
jgi:hypothetical protein